MMVLLGKSLLALIALAVVWSGYTACKEKHAQKRKAQESERNLDRLQDQFDLLVEQDCDMDSLLEDESFRELVRVLIKAHQEFAQTHLWVDCEPDIGRLIRLLMSGPASETLAS